MLVLMSFSFEFRWVTNFKSKFSKILATVTHVIKINFHVQGHPSAVILNNEEVGHLTIDTLQLSPTRTWLVVATRPRPRDGGVEKLHGSPTVEQHPKV